MAPENAMPITGDQMDVLDRLWDVFEKVAIHWSSLAIRGGFSDYIDAMSHYDYISKFPPDNILITRRDLKIVIGLSNILYSVKVDWKRVAERSGLKDEEMAKIHHHDLAMLERTCNIPRDINDAPCPHVFLGLSAG
ncbi:hypothetical protein PG994_001098 [Apiospora phragmitis]|uniref:Uncharacterized protein n=1 Tax=Apiospora phragmitis TaxID=2905665 RepID=A0ABR1WSJ4_9PEZI